MLRLSSKLLGVLLSAALLGSLLVSLLVTLVGCGSALPVGREGEEAERLTDCMLSALNAEGFAWAAAAQWRFAGHSYVWRRDLGLARVELDDDERVYLNLRTQQAVAFEDGERLEGEALAQAHKRALKAFHNDSFWPFAPFKVRDEGTTRALVELPEGRGLLVRYASGGSTPGDSYLWHLNEACRPTKWQMWVSVIPIDGVEASWEGWRQSATRAWLSTSHTLFGLTFSVSDLKLVSRFEALALSDPWLEAEGWLSAEP